MNGILIGALIFAAAAALGWASIAHPSHFRTTATILLPAVAVVGVCVVLLTVAGLYSTVLGMGKGTAPIEVEAVRDLASDLKVLFWVVGVPAGLVCYLTLLRLLPRLLGHERGDISRTR